MKDQTVVVIGGSSGMGFAIARHAQEAGAKVVIGSRSQAHVDEAVRRLGPAASGSIVDAMHEESVSAFFRRVGPLDHLVLPGSSVRVGGLKELPLDEALYSMRNKFFGKYLCAKHATINPTGSLLLFSGILSRRPGQDDALLAGINAGVEGMGRALALSLAPVRVNVISPGMTAGTAAYQGMAEDLRASMFMKIAARLPVRRVGTPEDIAQVALMLMRNSFITGTVIDVDGGGLLT